MDRPAPHHSTDDAPRTRRIVRESLPTVALLALLFVTRASFANHYVVPTGSMEVTLMPGDRVVVDMTAYGVRVPYSSHVLVARDRPGRGDVVLLPSPADGTRLIKRVVGVAGDRVTLRGGHLSIDGRRVAIDAVGLRERLGTREVPVGLARGGGPDVDVVVPAGHVFVVGDNRGNSADSRMFGPVPEASVYARAERVYWRRGEGVTWRDL